MPQLVNQFDLKPYIERARFDKAWDLFISYLIETDLAIGAGPVMTRHHDSGFDTDAQRDHRFLALIRFRDHAQADAAWAAIESKAEPLAKLHRTVFAMVHNPVFTFWDD
ncbi:MAG: DUF6614 family protein [Arenibacterium sp.]